MIHRVRRSTGILAGLAMLAGSAAAQSFDVYFGTSARDPHGAIYRARFDAEAGRLAPAERVAETLRPSFLALHPDGRFLYAVNEVDDFEGGATGAVSAFAVDPAGGGLRALNQVSARGKDPCHLTVDRLGRHVLVANYSSGTVTTLAIGADGRLGAATAEVQHAGRSVDPDRQTGPHAHSIDLDAANRHAFVSDLGLDQVLVYRYDAARGTLRAADPPFVAAKPGAGPRHFAFAPDQRRAYVVNEMAQTVTVYRHDSGRLTETGSASLLPAGESPRPGTGAAEIQVHPSGRFLYASNRGPNVIVVFAIDPGTGALTRAAEVSTGGAWPRHFTLDPTGRWLLASNQNSDTVVVFAVNGQTGALTPTGQSIAVPAPSCAVFRAAGSAPRP